MVKACGEKLTKSTKTTTMQQDMHQFLKEDRKRKQAAEVEVDPSLVEMCRKRRKLKVAEELIAKGTIG